MNVAYKVDVSAPCARFGMMAHQAANPTRILQRWGGYLASESRKAFAAQDFAPLAPSTQKKYEQTRTAAVTVHGQVRKSYAGNLTKYLRGQMRAGNVNAETDLAELRRLMAGGAVNKAELAPTTGKRRAIERLQRAVEKAQRTGKRVGGDKRKIGRHKLLGRLSGSVYWEVQGRSKVKDLSRVPWSGAQNKGGVVGHGANLPPRTFLDITRRDEYTMALIAIDHLMGGR